MFRLNLLSYALAILFDELDMCYTPEECRQSCKRGAMVMLSLALLIIPGLILNNIIILGIGLFFLIPGMLALVFSYVQ